MASAGWGAVGGGAWGGGTASKNYEDEEPPRQEAPSHSAFGTNAYSAQPETSPAIQATNTSGFGASSGAYGQTAAGASFREQPSGLARAGSSTLSEAALRRKEAELAAKEKQLKELEAKLQAEGAVKPKKNWPICYPLVYHNIAEEIPERGRRVVREGYFTWYGLVLALLWNFFCSSVMLGTSARQKVPSWFLAVIYLIAGVPMSWWLWYRHLYQAIKKDSALHFVWFFCTFAIHTAFCIWAAIAVQFSANQWSFAGWMTAISAVDECTFCGIVYIVGASVWSLLAAWSCWVLADSFMFFRGKGGITQAKEEAKKEAALAAFRQGTVSNQV